MQLTLEEVRSVSMRRGIVDEWLLQVLHRQSQGWAAGITLMLERLSHLDANARDLPADTRESVFNYFASLIFDNASKDHRQILVSVAFLPQVTSELAAELSGREESAALLEDLYRRRMFIDRRPGPDSAYQFHALFLDFLRARARQTLEPDMLANLLRASAAALESVGNIDAAMDLWVAAQGWNEAVQLILKEANGLLGSGRRQTLARWIQQLPSGVVDAQPWVYYWLGRVQIQIDADDGTQILEHAFHAFARAGNREGETECLCALVEGSFVGFRALQAMDEWLDQLLHRIDPEQAFATVEHGLRVWGVLCVSLFHVRPWHPLTAHAYQRIEELVPQCSDRNVILTATMSALVVSGLSGDFERGDRIAAATEQFASAEVPARRRRPGGSRR